MTAYGDIFDYQLFAMLFERLSFGFMVGYGLLLACVILPVVSYSTIKGRLLAISATPVEI